MSSPTAASASEAEILRRQLRRCTGAWLRAETRAVRLESALVIAQAEHSLCCRHAVR